MNEVGLKKYVELYGKQKLSQDDFMCCLPEVFTKNYLVVHSSLAAQNSIPESPRIILTDFVFNDAGISKPPTAFFSVNGGHASLRQTHSYEVAFVNPDSGKAEFFDVDFSSSPPVVKGPNPPLCMMCHGTNGKAGVSGPRLIMDGPNVWPRFVNGLDFLSPVDGTPPPPWLTKYLERLNGMSRKALAENPRFKCLSKEVPTVSYQNELDHLIASLNRKRVAKEIMQTADYEKFKYAIAASDICPDMMRDLDCQLAAKPKAQCNAWIGPGLLRTMVQDGTLAPWVKEAKTAASLDKIGLEKFTARHKEIKEKVEKSNATNSTDGIDFEMRGKILSPRKQLLSGHAAKIQSLLLKKYAVDTELHGGTANPLTRFLFESRGVVTSGWGTDIILGYQRQPVGLNELMHTEPATGDLKRVMNQSGQSCDSLRKASLAATTDSSSQSGSDSHSTAQ